MSLEEDIEAVIAALERMDAHSEHGEALAGAMAGRLWTPLRQIGAALKDKPKTGKFVRELFRQHEGSDLLQAAMDLSRQEFSEYLRAPVKCDDREQRARVGGIFFNTAGSAYLEEKMRLMDAVRHAPREEEKESSRRRGRPRRPASNVADDARVFKTWKAGHYKKYSECARELGMKPDAVKAALERHRHRVKPAGNK